MKPEPKQQTINLADIRLDGGTQSRASLNDAAVGEYAAAIAEGASLPPIVVYFDGSAHWLADGFHRFHAHRKAMCETISAEVVTGTKRDAVLFSVGANDAHGLRRSNDDKRRAVKILLDDAEWSQWSDREVARRACVSVPFVGALRRPEIQGRQADNRQASAERKAITKPASTGVIGLHPEPVKESKPSKILPRPEIQTKPEPVADDEDQGPSLAELVDELAAENKVLLGLIETAQADDLKAEAIKWRKAYERAVVAQSEAMDSAARSEKREVFNKRQLMRCGKAVGEDDPRKIAAAVEAALKTKAP